MLRTVNHVARGLGFAWVGVLAFVLARPHGTYHLTVQIVGYCLLGAAQLAWALLDFQPAAIRHRTAGLPVVFGVMAVGAGIALRRRGRWYLARGLRGRGGDRGGQ